MDWDQRKVFVASMVDEIEINQKPKPCKKVGRETAKETMHFSALSEERRRQTVSVQDHVLKYFVHR